MRPPKTQINLGAQCENSDEADLSLHWAHMPFCWFCHDATESEEKSEVEKYFPSRVDHLKLKAVEQIRRVFGDNNRIILLLSP